MHKTKTPGAVRLPGLVVECGVDGYSPIKRTE